MKYSILSVLLFATFLIVLNGCDDDNVSPYPVFEIVNPNENTIWRYNEEYQIEWYSEELDPDMYILAELYKGDSLIYIIEPTFRENEYHQISYRLTHAFPPDDDYRIKITRGEKEYYSDYFTIKAEPLIVLQDYELAWTIGDTAKFAWDGEFLSNSLSVEMVKSFDNYFMDNDNIHYEITTLDGSVGNYEWIIADSITAGNYFKFLLTDEITKFRYYSPMFKLINPLKFNFPDSTSILIVGEQNVEILWDAAGVYTDNGNMTLEFYEGNTLLREIDEIDDEGEFGNFDLSDLLEPANDYYLKIINTTYGISALSDSFTIALTEPEFLTPGLSYAAPKGSEDLSIEWDTADYGGQVSLYLIKDNDYQNIIIAENVENNGLYTGWNIPDYIPVGSSYRIKMIHHPSSRRMLSSNFYILNENAYLISEPNYSTDWQMGSEEVLINYISSGFEHNISIELYRDDEYYLTIQANASDNGEFSNWAVPDTLEAGNSYQVHISNTVFDYDSLSEYFTIE